MSRERPAFRTEPNVPLLVAEFLSHDTQAAMWYRYITPDHLPGPDYYMPEQRDFLVIECLNRQQEHFEEALPYDCSWHLYAKEIMGPKGTVLPPNARLWDMLEAAANKVKADFVTTRKAGLAKWLPREEGDE